MALTATQFLEEQPSDRASRIMQELQQANAAVPEKLLHRIGNWLEVTTVSLQSFRTPGRKPSTFDSSQVPQLSVTKYLQRLGQFAHCSPTCFVAMVIYLDKYLTNVGPLTPRNAHRLVLAALCLSVKFWEDYHYDQAYFAYIGGVPPAHLTKLELAMMKSLGYELMILPAQFEVYNQNLQLGVKNASGSFFEDPRARIGSEARAPATVLADPAAVSTMAGSTDENTHTDKE